MISQINPYLLSFATAFTSVIITYIKLQNKDQTALRKEMKEEIAGLKMHISKMQIELDEWRDKYSNMKIENGALLVEIKTIKTQMEFVQDQWKNLDGNSKKPFLKPVEKK